MKKIWFTPMVVLMLLGCATARDFGVPALGLLGGLFGSSVARQAPATVLDASKLTAANHLAHAVFDSVTMAGRAGQISPSNDADTARPNFCELVIAELATITDEGGRASKLICLINHHLDSAKAALDARDPVAFAENLAKADTYTGQLQAMVNTSMSRGTAP